MIRKKGLYVCRDDALFSLNISEFQLIGSCVQNRYMQKANCGGDD
jgi:hypothetical protein